MRTAVVGVTLLGLLALVAAGSAGGEWGDGLEDRSVPGAFIDYAFTVGVLIVIGAIIANELRRRPPPDEEHGAADELEAVLTETLGELEVDPDPRRAVIQAYVRMEGVLGAP